MCTLRIPVRRCGQGGVGIWRCGQGGGPTWPRAKWGWCAAASAASLRPPGVRVGVWGWGRVGVSFTARTHTHTPNRARSRGFSDRARGVVQLYARCSDGFEDQGAEEALWGQERIVTSVLEDDFRASDCRFIAKHSRLGVFPAPSAACPRPRTSISDSRPHQTWTTEVKRLHRAVTIQTAYAPDSCRAE